MTEAEKIYNQIKELADKYKKNLQLKVDERIEEMESDDKSHYLIYRVLGVSTREGELIDIYQNKGRFLYKYAGSFLEEITIMCFKHKYPKAEKVRVNNSLSSKPKTFEIDCLVNKRAYEIKWKDATTDGDHITKEHTRVKVIQSYGYIPVRIMFYYPNRSQAIKIQETLKTLYLGVNGEYYYSDSAWEYVKKETGVDLLSILQRIADERDNCDTSK
jgi:hypothetical protein